MENKQSALQLLSITKLYREMMLYDRMLQILLQSYREYPELVHYYFLSNQILSAPHARLQT
jgi:hypothetical protein